MRVVPGPERSRCRAFVPPVQSLQKAATERSPGHPGNPDHGLASCPLHLEPCLHLAKFKRPPAPLLPANLRTSLARLLCAAAEMTVDQVRAQCPLVPKRPPSVCSLGPCTCLPHLPVATTSHVGGLGCRRWIGRLADCWPPPVRRQPTRLLPALIPSSSCAAEDEGVHHRLRPGGPHGSHLCRPCRCAQGRCCRLSAAVS